MNSTDKRTRQRHGATGTSTVEGSQWIVSHPECGATVFDHVAPSHETADRLAQQHYDCADIEYAIDKGGKFYAVKVGRWYKAMIGFINGRLAILHKHDDGTRTLEIEPYSADWQERAEGRAL